MSVKVTIRQKAIRVCASAAICGLSFSFLLGELVDQRASMLLDWKTDSRIFPAEYSVLQPVNAGVNLLSPAIWQEKFIAYNQISPATTQEDIVLVEAAPLREIEPVAEVHTQDVSMREVETILMSIHQATRDLTNVAPTNSEERIYTDQKQKLDLPIEERSRAIIGAVEAAPAKTLEIEKTLAINSNWQISGKILTDSGTGLNAEPGHYEIALYSKIDNEGNPIGYPLVQQILPAGVRDFHLVIPQAVKKGFLYGEFVAAKTGKRSWFSAPVNPVLQSKSSVYAEIIHRNEDKVSTVAATASRAATTKITGKVFTMFAKGNSLAQSDVVVKLRGRKEAARSNADGSFILEVPAFTGTTHLEFLKAGYHPMVVQVNANESNELNIEMASREAIDKIASSLGIRQVSSKGVLIGRIGTKSSTAQLSIKSDGPFYFSDQGFPGTDKKGIGADGRFIFFNVEAGVGFLEIQNAGEAVAPVQISFVEGGELIYKALLLTAGKIKGRLFNPILTGNQLTPVKGARIRIEGTTEYVVTDAYGAFTINSMKFIKSEELSLEVTAEKFYNHKYRLRAETKNLEREINLFAFPADYINRLATSMDLTLDPYSGLILGKAQGPAMRIDALSEHSPNNTAKDYYFDHRGKLLGSHQMTDPRFGTYIIFNVPKGKALLLGNDASGVTRYSDSISLNASSISVVMD
jgi:hypothetical protein